MKIYYSWWFTTIEAQALPDFVAEFNPQKWDKQSRQGLPTQRDHGWQAVLGANEVTLCNDSQLVSQLSCYAKIPVEGEAINFPLQRGRDKTLFTKIKLTCWCPVQTCQNAYIGQQHICHSRVYFSSMCDARGLNGPIMDDPLFSISDQWNLPR